MCPECSEDIQLGVYSHLILFGVGYIASLFFPEVKEKHKYTFCGWRDSRVNVPDA